MDTPVWTDQQNPTFITSDTGSRLDNLPRSISKDEERESKESVLSSRIDDKDDVYIYMGFDPGLGRPTCLATLKSSDRTKQSVCGWQYIRKQTAAAVAT